MSDKFEFKKVREFGEIINDTFTFIRENLKPLLKVFVYFGGVFIVALLVTNIGQQVSLLKDMRFASDGIFKSPYSVFTGWYFFYILFAIAYYNAICVAVLSYIAIYVEKGKIIPTVEQVWVYFKYYYFRALLSTIVITIFLIVCAIPCTIPLIYVSPAMALFLPVMIFENASFSYTFSRCFKLIKENWGVTAGAIFIIYIITQATMSIASIPALIVGFAGAFIHSAQGVDMFLAILGAILQSLFQVFIILPVVCSAICYYNVVERQENLGLLNRINELGEKKADFTGKEEY